MHRSADDLARIEIEYHNQISRIASRRDRGGVTDDQLPWFRCLQVKFDLVLNAVGDGHGSTVVHQARSRVLR